jgi:hypothetical protein
MCLSLFLSCKRRVKEKKAHFHRKTSLPIISPPHLFYFLPVSSIFFFFFTSLLFIDYYWLLFTKCFISKKKKIRACLSFLRLNSFFHTKERKRERSGLFRGAMMIISCVPPPHPTSSFSLFCASFHLWWWWYDSERSQHGIWSGSNMSTIMLYVNITYVTTHHHHFTPLPPTTLLQLPH